MPVPWAVQYLYFLFRKEWRTFHPITMFVLTVALSPVAQRLQHRTKTLALLGEVVLKPGRVLAVSTADNEIVRFHALQSCRQCVGGHPTQGLLKILKAARPMKKQITQ